MEQKKYGIIYADPPWTYRVYSSKGKGRSAASHYPVMDLKEIMALPVGSLADKDCALFLWVTFPNLQESFEVIRSWGFTYKTVAFVWIKQNRRADSLFWGMGYWTRATEAHTRRGVLIPLYVKFLKVLIKMALIRMFSGLGTNRCPAVLPAKVVWRKNSVSFRTQSMSFWTLPVIMTALCLGHPSIGARQAVLSPLFWTGLFMLTCAVAGIGSC